MQSASGDGASAPNQAEAGSEDLSRIACHNCRRRKVRCDRKLPVCSICIHNGQECSYPDRMLKPGPKLGSKNARNKRRRLADDDEDRDSAELDFPSDTVDEPEPEHNTESRRTVSMSSASALRNPKDIQSLSFIIHPSHESNTPEAQRIAASHSQSPAAVPNGSVLVTACAAMRIDPNVLNALVENFFKTFMSFRLFPESRFWAQTLQIQDVNTAIALMASMAAFSIKQWEPSPAQMGFSPVVTSLSPTVLIETAMKVANDALTACGDEPPPLPLLQALVLISDWLLIQGVRGRAWRYLGVCIRVAYELNLHLVDSDKSSDQADEDPQKWAMDEEKRRVWWTIWEMDVFASVIRRCPTAISWLQNETFLPAEDNMWEQQIPQRSCVLEINTMSRCKALQATGNQSPRAWFIVINSIMKDAQTISSPIGVNKLGASELGLESGTQNQAASIQSERIEEARKRLTTFYNAARYFNMALPQNLKYRGQYLSFETSSATHVKAGTKTLRELHAQIYSIHLMTQLAYLMTLKYQLFKTNSKQSNSSRSSHERRHSSGHGRHARPMTTAKTQEDVEQYFEASNSILDITHRCNDQFYRYINPFLVNTIWLAAAVQLLRRELYCANETEKELVNSNFEVLRMAYDQFIEHWRSIDTAKKNLDALEGQLKAFQEREKKDSNTNKRSGRADKGSEFYAGFEAANQPQRSSLGAEVQRNSTDDSSPATSMQSPAQVLLRGSTGAQMPTGQAQYPGIESPAMSGWPAGSNHIPNGSDSAGSTVDTTIGYGNEPFAMPDQAIFDPFALPNDFDFMGTGAGSYNTFDDVFSGSIF